jgi:hypothetical protein
VTNRNWGALSQCVVVSPKTRRQPWCASQSICVCVRVSVCHPIWAEVRRQYQVRRLVRVPSRWGRWRRLVDCEDVHLDLKCETTPPRQYQNLRLAHTFGSAKAPYTWPQCLAIPKHRPFGEILGWRRVLGTWPLSI